MLLETQGKISEAGQNAYFKFSIKGAMNVVEQSLEDSHDLFHKAVLIGSSNIGNASQCHFERVFLVN